MKEYLHTECKQETESEIKNRNRLSLINLQLVPFLFNALDQTEAL